MQIANHLMSIIIVISSLLFLVFLFCGYRTLKKGSGRKQIYIGNLPYQASKHDLQQCFSKHGHIKDIRIVKDRRTGRSKGYAFITFSNPREAKKALTAHGKELLGRSLVVHVAKAR